MNSNFIEIAHDKEINYLIKKNIAECKTDILIISAFVKVDIIKWIDDNINCSKKELLVRFRKSDIISGATDFELIEYCLLNKWHLKFDLNLHSKIYVFDQEKFLIGSANATNKGLSFIEDSNKETMIFGKLSKNDFNKINSIFHNAHQFEENTILNMKTELLDSNISVDNRNSDWSFEISNNKSIKDMILLKEDLLTSESIQNINENDCILLNMEYLLSNNFSQELLKERFLVLRLYSWLKLQLFEAPNHTLYFGELTKLLHNDIALNDVVLRVNVKNSLKILLNWISELDIKEVIIDRPNYSQRIRMNA